MKYREVVSEPKAAGASWIQFDEPTLVKDLDAHELAAFSVYTCVELTNLYLGPIWLYVL